MSDQPKAPTREYSDSEMRRILVRATELEVRGGGMISSADLRKVATDAGIDAAALDQAMREIDSAEQPRVERSDLLNALSLKNLGMVVAGSVLCSLSFAADGGHLGSFTALGIFGPTAAFTAWRAFHNRWRGSVGALLTELALFFASFTAMAFTLGGREGMGAALVFTVIFGWAGLAIANKRRRGGADAAPSTAETP
jgi:hypothetical protein